MKLYDIQNMFHQELDAFYATEEVDSFFYLLIDNYYSVTRIQLALNPDLTASNSSTILNALKSLRQHKPIQYILGKTEFFGLPFKLNKHTLIPRPETEELVAWVINEFANNNKPLNILDVGTGSGCIAISLAKKLPHANVYALDVSAEALKIAQYNATLNNVEVTFFETDILTNYDKTLLVSKTFDIIVSNPPYIREAEKQLMQPNVLNNEPHLALFVKDNNPLLFYEAISQFAVNNLTKKGMLFFEINEYLGRDMITLLRANFSNIELKQDIFKKDRMLKGILN